MSLAAYPLDHPGWGRLIAGCLRKWQKHPLDCDCPTYCRTTTPRKPGPKPKPAKPCMRNGCDDPARARGLCSRHYKRWWYRHRAVYVGNHRYVARSRLEAA